MIDVKGTLATTNKMEHPSKMQFSQHEIELIAKQAPGKQIYPEFDTEKSVGEISTAKVEGNKVVVTAKLDDNFCKRFLVPAIAVRDEITGQEKFELIHVGIVISPADKTLEAMDNNALAAERSPQRVGM